VLRPDRPVAHSPQRAGGPNVDGEQLSASASQYGWLLRSRVEDVIGSRSGSRFEDRQRFVGITTFFSGNGTYLLGNVSKECNYAD
jgi:hypothetical protein